MIPNIKIILFELNITSQNSNAQLMDVFQTFHSRDLGLC